MNLLGEHTDYNQGFALPFAIDEGVSVSATALEARRIEVAAVDLGESASWPADIVFPVPRPHAESGGWQAFVRGTLAELQLMGRPLTGARLEITGTVPMGSGLGSSAALAAAVALALIALANQPEPDRVELARMCSRVENQWVGAQTGLLDQLACLFGAEGHALQIDFRSLQVTPVPLELGDWRLVLLDSSQRRRNASSGYNQRREECAQACEMLSIPSLREATPEMIRSLPAPLNRRAQHVLSDNVRVGSAVEALQRGDLRALGRLLDVSHASLRDLFEVSTEPVEAAVARLKRAGAAGARLIGGGFGGQVLGLMPPGATTPAGATEVRPGRGAQLLSPA